MYFFLSNIVIKKTEEKILKYLEMLKEWNTTLPDLKITIHTENLEKIHKLYNSVSNDSNMKSNTEKKY
jgi:16S rRNA G527 N7-methylase RsmG